MRHTLVALVEDRPAALSQVDLVAIMDGGRLKTIGPRDEVLQSVMKRNVATNPAQQQVRAAASTNLREVG